MRIDGTSHQQKISSTQRRAEVKHADTDGSSKQRGDVVELSGDSANVAELRQLAQSQETEINPRLDTIKSRATAGYYNSEGVKRDIADAMTIAGVFDEIVQDVSDLKSLQDQARRLPDQRSESVSQARQRVNEGFYDKDDTRSATADKVLDELA